jgi:PKHD-type hydroxylase
MKDLVNYTYWIWEEALSPEFCDLVLSKANWAEAKTAGMQEGIVNTDLRRTDVLWQDRMQPLGCVAQTYIDSANKQAGWDYALTWQDNTQLSRYRADDAGYYNWHMDSFPPKNGEQRKLSCVILLNDSTEFEGGFLRIKEVESDNLLVKKGSIIVFPSFLEHTVTPVTKGVRYTAVTWASGPAFK